MKVSPFKRVSLALLLAAGLVMVLGAGPDGGGDFAIPEISQRINAFTLDLLRQCAGTKEFPANAVLSPQSVFHGAAASYIASGGDTREELRKAFHFPEKNDELTRGLADLRRQLRPADKHKRVAVTLANSLWLDETYADFRKEYVRELRDAFGAPLHRVKFGQQERVSREINQWVAEATRGKIERSVAPADFASQSRPGVVEEPGLVIVNAVYFNADWGSRFDKGATRQRPFRIDKTATVETPMMHQCSPLVYAENERFQFLEVPYVDGRCSMYLLLPKEVTGVGELMQGITVEQIVGLKQQAFVREVDVMLPKFEMKGHLDLKKTLAAMGVTAAFSNQAADFDRMIIKKAEASRIYLREIYHDAWIDVHEEGTEAAAATTAVHFPIGCSSRPCLPEPVSFHADHPFLFMIVHNDSRSILFAGWMSNPAAAGGTLPLVKPSTGAPGK